MPASVTLLAPENETQVAYRLADKIRATWPDLGPEDRVDILVGLQMVREIDIAVVIDPIQVRAQKHRSDRGRSATDWKTKGLALHAFSQSQGRAGTFRLMPLSDDGPQIPNASRG